MAHDTDHDGESFAPSRARGCAGLLLKLLGGLLVLIIALVAILWSQREGIADDYIAQTLDGMGVEATYEIESIGPETQVLRNIVVGDPALPDATIDRAIVHLRAGFGLPQVRAVELSGVRAWGRVVNGVPSFGALDPLLFTDSEEPFALPDLELTLTDAKALIEGDYGPVAISVEGSGHLQGGFSGQLAAVAPRLALAGCTAEQASLFGQVSVADQQPRFAGPLRFGPADCPDQGLAVAGGAVALDLVADRDMAGFEGDADLRLGAIGSAAASLATLEGDLRFGFRKGNLTSAFALAGRNLESGEVRLAALDAEGTLRARDGLARVELQADLAGRNVQAGSEWMAALSRAEAAGEGTLVEALAGQLRRQLGGQLRGSSLAANLTLRKTGDRLALDLPEARLRGGSGQSLLQVTRAYVGFSASGDPLFAGNFATGGDGLPRISGRIEQDPRGALDLTMRMAEYTAGDAQLALPRLRVRQSADGAFAFAGAVQASGALPGGFAERLEMPLNGTIGSNGTLAMWRECTDVRFARLRISNLSLDGRSVTLCPPSESPMLAWDARGLRMAAGVPALQLRGTLGETPLRLASGPLGFAWPGVITARAVAVELGDPASAARFTMTDLTARLGEDIGGTFAGTDVLLAAVPLDVREAAGDWRYADGALTLSGASFRLEDREAVDRFHPLAAQDATLTLADNVIRSQFALRHPASGTLVTGVDLLHDLSDASGHADLAVPGITFGPQFQPREISELAYGVVSLVEGTVAGAGRVDWNAQDITSSGRFSSDGLDFAAAFGPVAGARGTVVFTDLLGLTTAPDQRIEVASINPGIEINDGVILFSLTDATRLELASAEWPFLDGRLSMQPLVMNIGTAEERRYVFQIEGLQAARLIERMELNNMAATGTFDGILPVVFDAMGNGRLEGGMLSARPPGGHVSYIGQLTYEDLSVVGNYAFQALRDLDYDVMEVALNGPLTGELVTRVRLDGVRQGATAETNFITRRIAELPIRVVVNLRAPFYQMITSMRSLYDPAAVRDPRGLGLLAEDGRTLRDAVSGDEVPQQSDELPIQPSEREAMP